MPFASHMFLNNLQSMPLRQYVAYIGHFCLQENGTFACGQFRRYNDAAEEPYADFRVRLQ